MDNFEYEMGAAVTLTESGEKGKVIGRAEYDDADSQYRIRYKSGDGRQVECWWSPNALKPTE